MSKENLINHLLTNGRGSKTWLQLAKDFEIGIGLTEEQRAKKANDIYRGYERTQDRKLENFERGSKIKAIKKWQKNDGTWRTSIAYENTQSKFDLEQFRKDLVKDISEYELPSFKAKYDTYNNILALINISDAHIDKLTLVTETGFGSTIDDNVKVFKDKFNEMLTTASAFEPELIVFPVNGDLLNTNDDRGTTKRGTPQDVSTKHHDAFKVGLRLIRECVDKASLVAKVFVPVIRGNHDEDAIYYLGTALEAIYDGHPNVEIEATRTSRKYLKYGQNLLGFAHGDLEKPDQLPLIMAEEQKYAWADTKFRQWFLGDKHHAQEFMLRRGKDFIGCKVNYMRSITSTDNWHNKSGYIGVPKTTNLLLFDIEKGEKANFSFNV